jgi:hypothetical protein
MRIAPSRKLLGKLDGRKNSHADLFWYVCLAMATSRPHHWLRWAVPWEGLCSIAELCHRLLRQLLNRLADVESLRLGMARQLT